jgi:hypothetical protein
MVTSSHLSCIQYVLSTASTSHNRNVPFVSFNRSVDGAPLYFTEAARSSLASAISTSGLDELRFYFTTPQQLIPTPLTPLPTPTPLPHDRSKLTSSLAGCGLSYDDLSAVLQATVASSSLRVLKYIAQVFRLPSDPPYTPYPSTHRPFHFTFCDAAMLVFTLHSPRTHSLADSKPYFFVLSLSRRCYGFSQSVCRTTHYRRLFPHCSLLSLVCKR